MIGKKPSRLASIGLLVVSVGLTGSLPLTQTALDNRADGHKNDAAAYVKQITRDICTNRNPRLRTAAASRPADPGPGLAQPWPTATLPWPGLINPLPVEWLNPISLFIFKFAPRSPPA